MNNFFAFINGMFVMTIIVDIIFSYKEMGTPELRIFILVLCIIGISLSFLVNPISRRFAKKGQPEVRNPKLTRGKKG